MNQANSWQEIFRNSKKSHHQLSEIFKTDFPKTNFESIIPDHIIKLIKEHGTNSPIGIQYLPHNDENDSNLNEQGYEDPISDEKYNVAPGLIHRYQNRALFLPTSACPVHCRYCFRRNEISNRSRIFNKDYTAIKIYLQKNPQINEIIFTGGDPLLLSNKKLDEDLKFFSEISTIKYIRFHTRFPLVIPERINSELIKIIDKYQEHFLQIIMVLHINSSIEISKPVQESLKRLNQANIKMLSQSVLLKNVNNSASQLVDLFTVLCENQIQPYYLHHPDRVKNAMHFQVTIEEGRSLFLELKNQISGWMLPQYVLDLPSGGGKIPIFNPESISFSNRIINRNGISESYTQE